MAENNSDIAIRVKNISKVYPLYQRNRDRLLEAIHPLRKKYHTDFYALKDVSFEIKKGEAVGIIGQNGSGKSTLLKIISGVLTPTAGSVEVNGRIASLLELGTGFNPEMTGIENVFFFGSIHGFTRAQMEQKLGSILAFADIGDFVYQPVKHYSSGMFVRLAFACAIHTDPEILVVDEALAVGDVFFQAKCLVYLRQLAQQGITMLFVSHDINTVVSLCQRGILLEKGKMLRQGTAKEIGDYYYAIALQRKSELLDREERQEKSTVPNEPVRPIADSGGLIFGLERNWLREAWLENSNGVAIKELNFLEDYAVCYKVFAQRDLTNVSFGYRIYNQYGVDITGTTTAIEEDCERHVQTGRTYTCRFRVRNILSPGNYVVAVGLEKIAERNLHHSVIEVNMAAIEFVVKPPLDRRRVPLSKTVVDVFRTEIFDE